MASVNRGQHKQYKRNFLGEVALEGIIGVLQTFRGLSSYTKKLGSTR